MAQQRCSSMLVRGTLLSEAGCSAMLCTKSYCAPWLPIALESTVVAPAQSPSGVHSLCVDGDSSWGRAPRRLPRWFAAASSLPCTTSICCPPSPSPRVSSVCSWMCWAHSGEAARAADTEKIYKCAIREFETGQACATSNPLITPWKDRHTLVLP